MMSSAIKLFLFTMILTLNSGAVDFTLKNVVTQKIAPNRFVDLGSGHYFVEFPKAAFGTVDVTITATSSQTVTLRFGEKKTGDAVNTSPGQDVQYKSEQLSVTAGTKTYRITQHPSVWAGGQPDKLFPTLAFRYVEILNCPGTFSAASINQIMVIYPFNDSTSRFTSSNSTLNAVWDLCKYSMKACSWLGIYVDGTRERKPYEADAYIQQLGHYCQDTQAYAIARNTFTHLLSNPTWPAEWKFHSIYEAWAEYMWTGDTSFLSSNYSTLKTKTLESYARADGLINPPGAGGSISENAEIVDWPWQYRDGYAMGNYASATNAQYYQALVAMAKIASVLGKTSDATTYTSKANTVYNAFQAAYFDNSKGYYKDSDGATHYALHASAYPLFTGLVPAGKMATVVSYVKSRGMAAGVYGAQYVVEGIYNADEEDYGLSLLASTGSNGWYNMIAKGSTITTEAFDVGYGDWNHAWGAAPANLIPRCVMGIDPIGAGFSKIQIKPQIGSLTSASVTIPTVKGPVSVVATKGVSYTITATIPSGATGKVYVKKYGYTGTVVKIDGVDTNGVAEGNYIVFDNVPSGTHTFEASMSTSTPAKNLAAGAGVTGCSSLENADWGVAKLTDSITSSVTGSKGYTSNPEATTPNSHQCVEIDLGQAMQFNQIKLYPRTDVKTAAGYAPGWPVNYTIQVKDDAGAYRTIQTVTLDTNKTSQPKVFDFSTQSGRYVKIDVTVLGTPASDDIGRYRLQLAELEVYYIPKVTAVQYRKVIAVHGSPVITMIRGATPMVKITAPCRYDVRLINAQGKVLVRQNGKESGTIVLPRNSFSRGIYFVQVQGAGFNMTKKAIVF